MLILAADTSTNAGSLAIAESGEPFRVLIERSWDLALLKTAPNHSARIVPEIEEIVRAAGITWKDVGGLACATGPGSFTGLRVALSALKGIALARDLPLAGVSTLEAMAAGLPFASRLFVPLLDARKSEIYGAAYDLSDGAPRRVIEETVIAPDVFLKRVADLGRPVLLAGEGVRAYADLVRNVLPGAVVVDGSAALPRAGNVAKLAAPLLARGRVPETEAAGVVPAYLRRPEAEWKRL